MGCSIGKLLSRRSKNDRESEKNLMIPEPPPPAPTDPRLPLSAKQKFSMVKSWKGIIRAMEPTGVNMFLKLFAEHGELLNLFTKFRELRTTSQQADSLELAEHATVVMTSIDEGIKAMDNIDFFFDLLREIGATHTRIPGFKKEYFWKIENPFLESVKLTLDERYTENIENIYKIAIKFIIETVIKGFDDSLLLNENKVEESNLTDNSNGHPESTINDAIHNIKSTASASYQAVKSNPNVNETQCPKFSQIPTQNEVNQQTKNNNNISNS